MHKLTYKPNLIKRLSLAFSVVFVSALVSVGAHAAVRNYSVDVERSSWEVSKQTRLVCELRHPIPGYGTASFVTEASKQLNLEFRYGPLIWSPLISVGLLANIADEPSKKPCTAANQTPTTISSNPISVSGGTNLKVMDPSPMSRIETNDPNGMAPSKT